MSSPMPIYRARRISSSRSFLQSSATRDRRDKFDLYAMHGVAEYWLISPEARIVRVFVLRGGVFEEVGRYCENDTLTSTTLEGLEIDLSEVFGA